MEKVMNNYLGSKGGSGVYQKIIALMPPHDVYMEPFLGSGQILRRKPPAAQSIVMDIDKNVISSMQYCADVYAVSNLTIGAGDGLLMLDDYNFTGRELVYCDPPYMLETRSSKARYDHEFSEDDHRRLLSTVKKLCCSVIISGYASSLYDDELSDWNRMEFQAMTRGGVRTEVVWFNYDRSKVQWCDYAGENYTHRQQIKRKAARWAKRYMTMLPGERLAVMSEMMKVEELCNGN